MNTMFGVTTGCGFKSPAGKLKITDCLSDEMLNRGPVSRCYMPSTLKNQAEFSVVLSCILALSPEQLTVFWGHRLDGQPVVTINKRK